MKNFMDWLKKSKIIVSISCLTMIALPIIIIHFLFKTPAKFQVFEAEWSAGDILNYFGDVLAFIGTIILGVVAISQTEKSNKMNEELLKIEKNKLKPRLEILSSQLYSIYLGDEIIKKESEINRQNDMIIETLYTSIPRTGVTTNVALLELSLSNTGGSDIHCVYIKSSQLYLCVIDPFSNCEQISLLSGNSQLSINEEKKLFIKICREVIGNPDSQNQWYEDNIEELMPRINFQLELETKNGDRYIENINCGSNWDITMKNENNIAIRGIGIAYIDVNEK